MNQVVFLLCCCLSVAWASYAKLIRNKPCPEDRPILSPLDLEKISGFWYLLFDYQTSTTKEDQCDCSIYEIQLKDRENCFVKGCCRKLSADSDRCDSIPKGLTFKKTVFEKFDPEAKGVFDWLDRYYFTVLDSDYENFGIAYACKNLADGQSQEEIRIGSRSPTLNPEVQERVDKIIDKFFDRSMLRRIEHDEIK